MEIRFKVKDLYKADPYRVYDELQELGENIKPVDIVERAKDTSSELHKCFEWDDTAAAHKYRIQQARALVGNLVIIESKQEEEPQQIRVMYTAEKGGYKQTKMILQNQSDYEALLERARNELKAFKQKYSMLLELHEIFELID